VSADPVIAHAIVAALGDDDAADFDAAMSRATPDDQLAAAQLLARAARPSRSLLAVTYDELGALALDGLRKGHALWWLQDQLAPIWASWPGKQLADILMAKRASEVEELRAQLALVGIEMDR
jgi:hypothetical protein